MTEAERVAEIADDVVDRSEVEDQEVGSAIRYSISSYGADHPVDGLVKRIKTGDIYIPSFQRGFVWNHAQASRFVESLLLGLPVPGIFLFKEPDTQKLVVVDGQQRLRTLQGFYDGLLLKREFALRGVCEELAGMTYKKLPEEDRRRLDDAIVHATVFQQDDPLGDRSSIYLIFERLNTGGTPLSPQEIRSCVYGGRLNDLLKKLAAADNWRTVYGSPSRRAKDQELILRFFALYHEANSYSRPMKQFLNDFMAEHRDVDEVTAEQWEDLFLNTARHAALHLTREKFRPERNLNAAVLDSLFVGLARRLTEGQITQPQDLPEVAGGVLSNEGFIKAISSGTTDLESIRLRLTLATERFAGVK